MSETSYRVGSRDSLLAVVQTKAILQELKDKTGAEFEMITMKTAGDLDTSKPLWQLNGKNFFTKELDQALQDDKVDLIVSSYKDIGSERPKGIKTAVVTQRHFSNDILLIKKSSIGKISSMKEFIVGTSSPRRIYNITNNLSQYLPATDLDLRCETLRGNVPTRIGKLQDDKYDAIILALAGLERLAQDPESKPTLEKLLDGLTFMVLPEKIFPSSPAQGALAIECMDNRDDNGKLEEILSKINHQQSIDEIKKEREHFNLFGGGCHLAVGIYCKKIANSFLHVIKGQHQDKNISKTTLEIKRPSPKGKKAFIGLPAESINDESFTGDNLFHKTPLAKVTSSLHNVLVSSSYCIPVLEQNLPNENSDEIIWVSGDKTFKRVAEKGYWVHGSADSLGDHLIKEYTNSEAIKIMLPSEPLKILSSNQAKSTIGTIVPCYKKEQRQLSAKEVNELDSLTTFYWTSFSQYESYTQKHPSIAATDKIHCCGLGKTYNEFISKNILVNPFIDITEFKNWFLQIPG